MPMIPVKRIINKHANKCFAENQLRISDLPSECIADSGACGSFQTDDGYCPISGCLGCMLKEVMLIA